MPLADHQIRSAVDRGELGIDGFDPQLVQPASYDLRVGPLVYSAASATPDQPYDLSHNGGAFRLPPYGSAVFMTLESLRMPTTLAGRFGLTSSYARKGILASTGPQVDPGFRGKLFVSLMNLSAVSHVITYKDTFLSIVFDRLDAAPEKGYDGEYQDKYSITPEILEDLVRLEGVNLSQMQSQFTELTQHVREWSSFARRFDEFMDGMRRHTDVLERLTASLAVRPSEEIPTVELRAVDLATAKREILELFRQERGERLYYSDLAERLRLDFAVVIQACRELQDEGAIEAAGE